MISRTVSTQLPHPVPAPHPSPTFSTVFAPARRQLRTSDSVTAMHMQTNIAESSFGGSL
jgi:hypothetical protein